MNKRRFPRSQQEILANNCADLVVTASMEGVPRIMNLLRAMWSSWFYWVLTLGLSVGWPALIWIVPKSEVKLLWPLMIGYVTPPFMIAQWLRLDESTSSFVHSGSLFSGYMVVGPSSVAGWLFCAAFWSLIGTLLWLVGRFLQSVRPVSENDNTNLDW